MAGILGRSHARRIDKLLESGMADSSCEATVDNRFHTSCHQNGLKLGLVFSTGFSFEGLGRGCDADEPSITNQKATQHSTNVNQASLSKLLQVSFHTRIVRIMKRAQLSAQDTRSSLHTVAPGTMRPTGQRIGL